MTLEGLSTEAAGGILAERGPNQLPKQRGVHPLAIGEISLADCALSLLLGATPVTIVELVKLARRHVPRFAVDRRPA